MEDNELDTWNDIKFVHPLLKILSKYFNIKRRYRYELWQHLGTYPQGWHFVKRHYGVRTDRYKLIHFYKDIDAWEFYDLNNDPNELNNIYNNPNYSLAIERTREELLKLQSEMGDTISLKNFP